MWRLYGLKYPSQYSGGRGKKRSRGYSVPQQRGGFGAGAQTGELCGAITGAIMTLGMITPVNPEDPVGSKRRTGALAKAFQARFREKFGEVRCRPLLKADIHADDNTPVARDMGLTNRCDVMIITAMEIVEEIRAQQA